LGCYEEIVKDWCLLIEVDDGGRRKRVGGGVQEEVGCGAAAVKSELGGRYDVDSLKRES